MNNVIETILNLPQVEEELEHFFVDNMYCRSMSLQAGVLVVGHKHKKPSINILAKGSMIIKKSIDDNDGKLIEAPYIFIGEVGKHKIAYTITDITFINVFNVEATTVEEAEEEVAEPYNNSLPYKRRKEITCQ